MAEDDHWLSLNGSFADESIDYPHELASIDVPRLNLQRDSEKLNMKSRAVV